SAVEAAAPAAEAGKLVLFGVQPTKPATGFGYIQAGAAPDADARVRPVRAFVEKPDAATAAAYLESGDYYWNAGIFLFSARAICAELGLFEPDVLSCVQEAVANATSDLDFLRLDAAA